MENKNNNNIKEDNKRTYSWLKYCYLYILIILFISYCLINVLTFDKTYKSISGKIEGIDTVSSGDGIIIYARFYYVEKNLKFHHKWVASDIGQTAKTSDTIRVFKRINMDQVVVGSKLSAIIWIVSSSLVNIYIILGGLLLYFVNSFLYLKYIKKEHFISYYRNKIKLN